MDQAITQWFNSLAGSNALLDSIMIMATKVGIPLLVARDPAKVFRPPHVRNHSPSSSKQAEVPIMRSKLICSLVAAACVVAAPPAEGALCAKQSPPYTVALVELYTSEGCDSCPRADRWLSGIAREGPGADSVVALALHVDYWDRLGWKDRFASARFSERQQELTHVAGGRTVYTPGVFFNLQEFRGWDSQARFRRALRAANARPAGADIRLEIETQSRGRFGIKASFKAKAGAAGAPQAFLAVYENRLRTDVGAGENRGVTLRHDFVVREWIGPIRVAGSAELSHLLPLGRDWKAEDLGVAAFVQDAGGRDILQATALSACSPT